MLKWKQGKGASATFENLIKAFEDIGYKMYADYVRKVCEESGDGSSAPTPSDTLKTKTPTGDSRSFQPPIKLSHAFRLLIPLSHRWKNIGLLLELDNRRLKKISEDCEGDPDDCLREMLNLWLTQDEPGPTIKALAEAVGTYDSKLALEIQGSCQEGGADDTKCEHHGKDGEC